ncbi:PapB/FocB family fimbrial expression transcriptional regulator [Escherichia coli]
MQVGECVYALFFLCKKTYNSGLQRASVNDEHFSLLIEISPIRSEKTM